MKRIFKTSGQIEPRFFLNEKYSVALSVLRVFSTIEMTSENLAGVEFKNPPCARLKITTFNYGDFDLYDASSSSRLDRFPRSDRPRINFPVKYKFRTFKENCNGDVSDKIESCGIF